MGPVSLLLPVPFPTDFQQVMILLCNIQEIFLIPSIYRFPCPLPQTVVPVGASCPLSPCFRQPVYGSIHISMDKLPFCSRSIYSYPPNKTNATYNLSADSLQSSIKLCRQESSLLKPEFDFNLLQ